MITKNNDEIKWNITEGARPNKNVQIVIQQPSNIQGLTSLST